MATGLYKKRTRVIVSRDIEPSNPNELRGIDSIRVEAVEAAELQARLDAAPALAPNARPPLHAHAKHTVAMVRMHRQLRSASRRGRVPKSRFPKVIETAYATKLVSIVHHARSLVAPLIAEIKPLIERAQASRKDSASIDEQTIAGLRIVVELHAGDTRTWTMPDGSTRSAPMLYDYGYIDGVIGADGEDVDVYLGPDIGRLAMREKLGEMYGMPELATVYVVDQLRAPDFKELDEQKLMLGWSDATSARDAYQAQYRDPRFFGGITAIPMREFRKQLLVADDGIIRAADRMDASDVQQIRSLVDRARAKFEAVINTNELESIAQDFGERTSVAQRQLFARQARAALGIDPVLLDKKIPTIIDHFVGENVSLIKTLGSNTFDQVEKMTTRAVTSGIRHEELAEDLEERFDISERHARLVARDQVGKLTAQVSQSRAEDLGLSQFTWETAGDERVRPEHEDLEGDTFDYGEGAPGEGMPGEPICCRCSASPIFDDLLGAAEGEDTDGEDAEN